MLLLEQRSDDDPAFLDLAGRLIGGAAIAYDLGVVAVHIDHWFGDRWLGFCGKYLGITGVRTADFTESLTPPPFHPHRIRSVRYYWHSAEGFQYSDYTSSPHGYRPSQSNISRKLFGRTLYAWYSGDTTAIDKAAIMVYVMNKTGNDAWYVRFDKMQEWRVAQTVRISPRRVLELIEQGAVRDPAAK